MIDCLIGFIGLASSVEVSGSGLYLNTLPDINIANTKKIADSDQSGDDSQLKVFKDVEQRAINRFRTLFIIEFNKCFHIYKKDSIDCLICENKELFAVALQYLMGVEMLQERLGSDRINRYTTVDRSRTQKLKDEFEASFYQELEASVRSIDITGSTCFQDEEPECGGFIEVIESCP